MEFKVPVRGNKKLREIVKRVNANKAIKTLWRASNIVAIDRLMLTDHGPVHVKIVTNIALKMLRLFVASGVEPSICKDYGLTSDDAEVVILLAAALHDIGHPVHRVDHEVFSVVLASQYLPSLLEGVYEEETGVIITTEALHAIHAHRKDVKALTIEAGILSVADALDIEQGRARIPFDAGSTSIHAISAVSIEKVTISKGKKRPVRIEIVMDNPAGMFQVDYLLKRKIEASGVGEHIEVYVDPLTGKMNKRRVW